MAKKRKRNTAKPKPEPVTTKDEEEGDATPATTTTAKPQGKAGRGATPAANALANTLLDDDDDDHCKRKGTIGRQDAALRRERRRLYELQESKRRLRQEEGRTKNTIDGETPLLRKVKRLKTERKAIIDEYAVTGGSMKKKTVQKKKRSQGIPLPK